MKTGIFQSAHSHPPQRAIKAEGSNERGFSAVSSSNSTQRLTRAETSGIILWESDMKFYYKNPLRCMMITWKALMRKIHLLWRIATGGSKWRKAENANQHTLTADSKFQFYAIKSEVGRERARAKEGA